MVPEEVKQKAAKLVWLHDGKSYDELKVMMAPVVIEKNDKWFTKERYLSVCEVIEHNIGTAIDIVFMDKLERKEKALTLWKVKYSNTEDDVLWTIGFDPGLHSIIDMNVNW